MASALEIAEGKPSGDAWTALVAAVVADGGFAPEVRDALASWPAHWRVLTPEIGADPGHPAWPLVRAILPYTHSVSTPDVLTLGAAGKLRELTLLSLAKDFTAKDLAHIGRSPDFSSLTHLNAIRGGVGIAGAKAVAEGPNYATLTRLVFHNNDIGSEGARALAESPHLGALEELFVSFNGIGAVGGVAIAESAALLKLVQWHAFGNPLGPPTAEALGRTPHRARLTSLMLGRGELGAAGAKALAEGEHLGGLDELYLSANQLGDPGALALAASDTLRLTLLALTNNGISDRGAAPLLRSPALAGATRLDLNHNRLGRASLLALLDPAVPQALRRYVFDLCKEDFSPAELKAGLKQLGVKGYSKLKKVDLLALIDAQV